MAERKSTKYPGVYISQSQKYRYHGKPDIVYIIDYRNAAGKRQRKTVGRASGGMTAALANQMRLRIVNAVQQGALPSLVDDLTPKQPVMLLKDAWRRYRDEWLIAQGKRLKSDVSLFSLQLRDLAGLPLDQITPYRLECVMNAMRARGLSPQYIRHAVALVRRIMRRMRMWGLYDGPDPFQKITLPAVNNARERYLTPDEAHALLAELHKRSRMTWLMALISLHCGLRHGEIAALRHEDVNFADGTLYVRESKSGRARHAVMTDDVMDALRDLPPGRDGALLFPARGGGVRTEVSCTFERAVDAVGLNYSGEHTVKPDGSEVPMKIADRRRRIVFHSLRHTYASWLAMSGEHEIALAELLGHTSTEMTKRYAHLMDNARRGTARKISAVFHGDATSEKR